MIRRSRVSAGTVLVALAVVCLNQSTFALGTTVAPAFLRLGVSPNKPSDTASVAVRNDYDTAMTYDVALSDVETETGALTPTNVVSETTSKLFHVAINSITLQPKQSTNIAVNVTDVTDASPGGHYAALLIRPVNENIKTKQQSITQVISIGLFLTKEDGVKRELQLQDSSYKKWLFSLPKTDTISLKNNGNVEIVPRGFVAYSKGTKEYKKTMINESSLPVFASKTKNFTVSHEPFGFMMPGRYTRTISYRYDGQTEQKIVRQTFWYIPEWSIALAGLALALGMLRVKSTRNKRKHLPKPLPIVRSKSNAKSHTSTREVKKIPIQNEARVHGKNKPAKKAPIVSEFGSTKGIK